MLLIKKLLVFRHLRVILALSLLLVLPFFSTPSASAMEMHHTDAGIPGSCASICARTNTAELPQLPAISQDETRLPDPEPREGLPSYAQFQSLYIPKTIRPQQLFSLASFKPPDLPILYLNLRF